MKLNRFETIGITISIGAMALALFLIRMESAIFTEGGETDLATGQVASVVVSDDPNQDAALADAILEASTSSGKIERLIIDDVIVGSGKEVVEGSTVTVHYIGSLQNGQQFDNSYLKQEPFVFTVGDGKVIEGWEQGVIGMKEGGQRVLVIPSELAYGKNGYGPIPGNATLVFAIELLSIK